MSSAQVALTRLDAEEAMKKCRLSLEKEIRLALVGKTGVGKSATANTICGEKLFKSGLKASSMTKICQEGKSDFRGKTVLLIDTPGIFDSKEPLDNVEKEIKRCVHLGAPGLHAILFVMDINRFRDEDIETINTFLKFFNNSLLRYVIMVFTHGDKLEKENLTIEEFLKEAPTSVQDFLVQCDNRKVVFNNELGIDESSEQVSLLLTMVESLKQVNEMKYYTDVVFQEAERQIQRQEAIIKEQVIEIQEIRRDNFEKTKKVNLNEEMTKERDEEILKLRDEFENRLTKVRDEVRKEIAKERNGCKIS